VHDPFSRVVRLPGDFTREGRVALVGDAAGRLLRHEALTLEQSVFLGSALAGFLENGGNLERDYLRVSAPRGSHRRPEVVWRELDGSLIADERQDAKDEEHCAQSDPESSSS
jgi:hypothetical protein